MKEVVIRLKSNHVKVKGAEYVQDLIRCKECRKWGPLTHFCYNLKTRMPPMGFCSYGKPNVDE